MRKQNDNRAVVLLAHSMGVKTGHYLLEFALQKRGRAWIDENIHTFVTAGGPFLGAAQSVRSLVTGTRMGLPSAILSNEDALVMGRSFGSTPWLLPLTINGTINCEVMYQNLPYSPVIKKHGLLSVFLREAHLFHFLGAHYEKVPVFKIRVTFGKLSLSTNWFQPTGLNEAVSNLGMIELEFPTPYGWKAHSAHIKIELIEKGLALNQVEKRFNPEKTCSGWSTCTCLCPCCLLKTAYNLVKGTLQGTYYAAEQAANQAAKGFKSGTTVAIADVALHVQDSKELVGITIPLKSVAMNRKGGGAKLLVDIKYREWSSVIQEHSNLSFEKPRHDSNSAQPMFSLEVEKQMQEYQSLTVFDLMTMEKLNTHCFLWASEHYERNPLINARAPPVKNVLSVYGVNVETEIQQVFKRKARKKSNKTLASRYIIDRKSNLKSLAKSYGYKHKNGILYETKDTPQISVDGSIIYKSGDGTVPYASLQHVFRWKSSCNVEARELEGVEHRAMLNDSNFHKILLEYCTWPKGEDEDGSEKNNSSSEKIESTVTAKPVESPSVPPRDDPQATEFALPYPDN
uniref:Uncharacterized protein n=1 Tax=Aplanochytrium stocchinoi TaxID=215587 RepID=A0A7S3PN78_9STRA